MESNIIQYFPIWATALIMTVPRFIHITANGVIPLPHSRDVTPKEYYSSQKPCLPCTTWDKKLSLAFTAISETMIHSPCFLLFPPTACLVSSQSNQTHPLGPPPPLHRTCGFPCPAQLKSLSLLQCIRQHPIGSVLLEDPDWHIHTHLDLDVTWAG